MFRGKSCSLTGCSRWGTRSSSGWRCTRSDRALSLVAELQGCAGPVRVAVARADQQRPRTQCTSITGQTGRVILPRRDHLRVDAIQGPGRRSRPVQLPASRGRRAQHVTRSSGLRVRQQRLRIRAGLQPGRRSRARRPGRRRTSGTRSRSSPAAPTSRSRSPTTRSRWCGLTGRRRSPRLGSTRRLGRCWGPPANRHDSRRRGAPMNFFS